MKNKVQEKILNYVDTLEDGERFTSPQIRRDLNLNKDQISNGCMQLWEKGILERERLYGVSPPTYNYFKPSKKTNDMFKIAMKSLSMCYNPDIGVMR